MSKKTQQLLAFTFGVVFVVVLIVLAIGFPDPTPFQYEVFKVVLALAAAGVAAMIPGFIEIEVSKWLRAGGALGVFAVVYFYTPARIVAPEPEPNPTAQFPIVLACALPDGLKLNTFSFPVSDVRKNADYAGFRKLISQLPGQLCDQSDSKLFRMKDEAQLLPKSSLATTSAGNLGVIAIPAAVMQALGNDEHIAFTKIHSLLQARQPPATR